jgi:ferric-dicitrate binding protein FerR (iron transport regulator)
LNNRYEHIEELIAKFLVGEATIEEIDLVNEWRALSAENEQTFSQYEKIFVGGESLKNLIPVDTDAAWIKLKGKISNGEQAGKIIPIRSISSRAYFIRIAAILLIVAGLGMLAFFMTLPSPDNLAVINSNDSIHKLDLPDGSKITLNKKSHLAYSRDHFSKKRLVQLTGEAYFEVVHDEKNPFIVQASDLQIMDVGTAFNVKAKENSGIIIVSVVSGEVKVVTVNHETVNLHAGDEITYNMATREIGPTEKLSSNSNAYADRVFVFENADLSTVMRVLNEVYNVQLSTADSKLNTCRITVSFNNESINDIADVIAETLGLTLEKENNQIIFKGNGCK